MDTTCAVCRLSDGLVINMIIAPPSYPPPDGCQIVEVPTGQLCGIGWYYANGVFNGPKDFALCNAATNEVVSFFSASYVSPVPTPPAGYYGVELTPDLYCDIGWTWDGSQFNPPVA